MSCSKNDDELNGTELLRLVLLRLSLVCAGFVSLALLKVCLIAFALSHHTIFPTPLPFPRLPAREREREKKQQLATHSNKRGTASRLKTSAHKLPMKDRRS